MTAALEGLPGVETVRFQPEGDIFTLAGSGMPPAEEIQTAVMGQVVFLRLRKALGAVGDFLRGVNRPTMGARRE